MRIVAVDDYVDAIAYLTRVLHDYEVVGFSDPAAALEYASNTQFDLLIADQKMPHMTGIELVRSIPPRPFGYLSLILSAYTDADDLIEAVNSNLIYRYMVKPCSPSVLLQTVGRASEHLATIREAERLQRMLEDRNRRLEAENARLTAGTRSALDELVGESSAIAGVKHKVRLYALSEESVLILGETGTGKELVARALHENSRRSHAPIVTVNCAALPEHLIESELFGHERGAFTGAQTARDGLVDRASGGTLFLDEISELPSSLQSKLLRFLQFGTYYRIGSNRERHADVRIIAATNRPIDPDAADSPLRADLFYRVGALTIRVPPLRERPEDIIPIATAMAHRKGLGDFQMAPETLAMLYAHDFPGNVRELANMVERVHLEGNINELLVRALPDRSHAEIDLPRYLEQVEATIIADTLALNSGNVSATARALGLSRQGLHNKLARYGIRANERDGGIQVIG